jgi:hypothetical protein
LEPILYTWPKKRVLILEIWGVLCIFCTRILSYELHWILILFGVAAKLQNSPKKPKNLDVVENTTHKSPKMSTLGEHSSKYIGPNEKLHQIFPFSLPYRESQTSQSTIDIVLDQQPRSRSFAFAAGSCCKVCRDEL